MIVIADDITGAAEIAGIAFEHGQKVRLVCGCAGYSNEVASDETLVIATDMRSMTEAEAAEETRRIATHLSPLTTSLFKKTDSALRGHVIAELTALMQIAGYQRTVYCPANPSKGRIIRGGIYYIDQTPIDRTDFSFDPEFPATTAALKERFPEMASKGIIMPDAISQNDLFSIVRLYDDGNTLFAGAADLFKMTLPKTTKQATPQQQSEEFGEGPVLILCGSTQSRPLDLGIPILPMPREVYDGEQGADYWLAQYTTSLPQQEVAGEGLSLILTIPYTHRTGKEAAVHLRTVMAEMAKHIINEHFTPLPHKEGASEGLHLIIEGGATAWATLQALGWNEFKIERQVAPGVVQMRAANGTLVTLKPGSYPWGGLFEVKNEK